MAAIRGPLSQAPRSRAGTISTASPHPEFQTETLNTQARRKPSLDGGRTAGLRPRATPRFSGPPGVPRYRSPLAARGKAPAPPASRAKDTVPAPERRGAGAGGARHVRHLETTATGGVAPGPPRPGLQAQFPLAAPRRGPPPLARPAGAGREGPGDGEAGSRRRRAVPRPGPREGAPRRAAAAGSARVPHPPAPRSQASRTTAPDMPRARSPRC